MEIVQAPSPVLSSVAKSISQINDAILSLIEDMKVTLMNTKDPEGIGLAAPQVGKSLQIFIIKENKTAPFSIFINPKVTLIGDAELKKMPKKNSRLEGCLSLKDIWGTVKRFPKAKIEFTDEKGKKRTKTYSGFFATIIQHEFDHLQGILFPKRVLEQKGKLYKSRKNEKGEEVFDLIEL